MEATSVSSEFVPVDPEFVRQIGKSIQKLLVAARASDVSTDRVILLGKRQRADKHGYGGQGGQGGGGREQGNLQETIFTAGVRSGTLTHGERSYTDGSRSKEVFQETAAAQQRQFFFSGVQARNLNASLNVLAPCSMLRRQRRCAARSFYFCRFIGCRGRKDEGPSPSWEGTMRFLSAWTKERTEEREKERREKGKESSFPPRNSHKEYRALPLSPPLLSRDPHSSNTGSPL